MKHRGGGAGVGPGCLLLGQESTQLPGWLEWCSPIITHYIMHLVWLSGVAGFPLKLQGFTGRDHWFEIRNQQRGDGLLGISRPGRTSKIKLALFLRLARERLCGEGCGHCL